MIMIMNEEMMNDDDVGGESSKWCLLNWYSHDSYKHPQQTPTDDGNRGITRESKVRKPEQPEFRARVVITL